MIPNRDKFTPVPRKYIDRLRDQLACVMANWILNHIATEWYRARIEALIIIGIGTATRAREHR